MVKKYKLKGLKNRRILLPLAGVFLLFAVIVATNVITFQNVTNGGGGGPVGAEPKADVSVLNPVIAEEVFTYRVHITDLEKAIRSYLVTLIKVGGDSQELANQFYEPLGGVESIDHQLTASFHAGEGSYQLKLEVSDMDYNYDSDIIVLDYDPEADAATTQQQAPSGGFDASGFELFFGILALAVIIKRKRYHA